MKLRALGPGMVQQIQQRCSRCGGGGYSCPAADKCGHCDGKGLAPEKKVFEVSLPGSRLACLPACLPACLACLPACLPACSSMGHGTTLFPS
jgi:hypothetical protein